MANVKNLITLPFKSVTKQVSSMQVRSVLIELTAVHLLTETVLFFFMVLPNKEIKALPAFPPLTAPRYSTINQKSTVAYLG